MIRKLSTNAALLISVALTCTAVVALTRYLDALLVH